MELLPSPEGEFCTAAISWKNHMEAVDAMVYHVYSKVRNVRLPSIPRSLMNLREKRRKEYECTYMLKIYNKCKYP